MFSAKGDRIGARGQGRDGALKGTQGEHGGGREGGVGERGHERDWRAREGLGGQERERGIGLHRDEEGGRKVEELQMRPQN